MTINSFEDLIASTNRQEVHDYLADKNDPGLAINFVDIVLQNGNHNKAGGSTSTFNQDVANLFPDGDPIKASILSENEKLMTSSPRPKPGSSCANTDATWTIDLNGVCHSPQEQEAEAKKNAPDYTVDSTIYGPGGPYTAHSDVYKNK